jgi:hypothetical protein
MMMFFVLLWIWIFDVAFLSWGFDFEGFIFGAGVATCM